VPEQDGVHTPSTHCASPGHCVASLHWFAGSTQEPFRHFAPAPSLVAHVLSVVHSGGGPESILPPSTGPVEATHDTLPFWSVHS